MVSVTVSLLAVVAGCGDGAPAANDRPSIVVSTSILGDVVQRLVGDDADVEVLMPPGADPHDFAPSARQAAALREADAVVVNGLGFEAGLVDTIDAAEADGVVVIVATDAIDPIPIDGGHDDEGTVDDPHFFTDPVRMHEAVAAIADRLADEVPELGAGLRPRSDAYLDELDALHEEVRSLLADIPAERRILITNHEVLGYFADRYGFEVLGVVIPGGSTLAEPSAADLAALRHEIDEHDVPAIFADTSSPTRLAEALATEGTEVAVVELYSESLGEPGSPGDTYIGMVRTNAERIAEALS